MRLELIGIVDGSWECDPRQREIFDACVTVGGRDLIDEYWELPFKGKVTVTINGTLVASGHADIHRGWAHSSWTWENDCAQVDGFDLVEALRAYYGQSITLVIEDARG